jgi:hypothetical protein
MKLIARHQKGKATGSFELARSKRCSLQALYGNGVLLIGS